MQHVISRVSCMTTNVAEFEVLANGTKSQDAVPLFILFLFFLQTMSIEVLAFFEYQSKVLSIISAEFPKRW